MDTNSLILLLIAVLNAVTAALTLMTRNDIHHLEKNTNSLMTQLVATTKTEAYAAGVKQEKDRTE